MSAVPKKKLCWNCEGNVAKNIDNCPYCGVYLHAEEIQDSTTWNPTYRSDTEEEETPSPLYPIDSKLKQDLNQQDESGADSDSDEPTAWSQVLSQLKRDVFPTLFLMMGSIFFLFGVVLLLFSQNGTFTLQWQEKDGLYFFLSSAPLLIFGWIYFQRLDSDE